MTRVLVPLLTDPPARPLGGVVHALAGETMGTTWSVKLTAQAAAALERAGVKSCLVEVGGELRGTGAKPDGQPWWVELERAPTANDALRTVVALHDLAVATSGDYRRFFDHDGRRYAHTLDPASGAPSDHGVVSVTVLAKTCMDADAWATALTVMGPDAALAFATAHDLPALIVSKAAKGLEERLSPALQAMLDA
jgi:thiamine biosynthesis lipoprotein